MRIEISDLYKEIKGISVLKGINIEMEGGKVYGLKGRNGAGKTMLMRCIAGLIYPTKGEIVIDGEVLGKDISFPRSIGILLENPAFLPTYTGWRNLKILANIKKKIGDDEINCAMTSVGLQPNDKRTYKKYSLGMKQRLGIAAAIMEKPDLIILDEPFNALDEGGVKLVQKNLEEQKNRGAVCIVTCHDLEDLERVSDEILEMDDGEIIKHRVIRN